MTRLVGVLLLAGFLPLRTRRWVRSTRARARARANARGDEEIETGPSYSRYSRCRYLAAGLPSSSLLLLFISPPRVVFVPVSLPPAPRSSPPLRLCPLAGFFPSAREILPIPECPQEQRDQNTVDGWTSSRSQGGKISRAVPRDRASGWCLSVSRLKTYLLPVFRARSCARTHTRVQRPPTIRQRWERGGRRGWNVSPVARSRHVYTDRRLDEN